MNYLNSLIKKIKDLDLDDRIDLEEVKKAYYFAEKAHE
jgi:hypothetical protein